MIIIIIVLYRASGLESKQILAILIPMSPKYFFCFLVILLSHYSNDIGINT